MTSTEHDGMDLEESDCQFCAQIEIYSQKSMGKRDVHELFHAECSNCRRFADQTQNLCPMCQHLRIRHLVNCVWSLHLTTEDENAVVGSPERVKELSVELGDSFKFSGSCELCSFLQHTSQLEGYVSPRCVYGKIKRMLLLFIRPSTRPTQFRHHAKFRVDICMDRSVHLHWVHSFQGSSPPSVQPALQWATLKGWRHDCETNHTECAERYLKPPDSFRVIDVGRRKVVKASRACRFVALSYVWGADQKLTTLTATTETISSLEKDGALQASKLPRTIEDAIQACTLLGQEYLWVDRLCIVQDDEDNKHQQIDAMANIYSSADFVIVVLNGDMHPGIPGIQNRIADVQRSTEITGLMIINELPGLLELIRESAWAKRGWTYQEAVLARRKLFFGYAQAFFQCKYDTQEEDALKRLNWSYTEGSSLASHGWSFKEWEEHVQLYSSRSLSYSSDIYDAMAGITSVLLPQRDGFLFGLPRPNFDRALLWGNALREEYRTSESTKLLLPRWSWVSVHGASEYRRLPQYAGTLVAWKFQEEVSEHGKPLKFVRVRDKWYAEYEKLDWKAERTNYYRFRTEPGDNIGKCPFITATGASLNSPKLYGGESDIDDSSIQLFIFGIAWSQGCIESTCPFPGLTQDTFLALGVWLESNWNSLVDLSHDVVLAERTADPLSVETHFKIDQCAIKGRAQTSVFAAGEPGTVYAEMFCIPVRDDDGVVVGQIYAGEDGNAKAPLELPVPRRYEFIALAVGYFRSAYNALIHNLYADNPSKEHLWQEFRTFSLHNRHTEEEMRRICRVLGPDGLDISHFDSEGSALRYIPIVHVMLAEWDGPVARRISIGWVFLTKWVKSNPQFKTVYLN